MQDALSHRSYSVFNAMITFINSSQFFSNTKSLQTPNLQFQYNGAMLRTNLYPKSSKQQPKKQRSQQPKQMRSRKNNSPSPIYKEININKENVHPNKNAVQAVLEQSKYREAYFQLKQQSLNSKIEKQKETDCLGQSPLYRHYRKMPREIQIKINNKSLEKCQIHPQFQPSPKAQFLLGYPSQSKDAPDVLCCESCGWMHGNKVPLDKLTNTFVSPGLTIKDYFTRLQDKIDKLEIARTNLAGYQKQFRAMSSVQSQKLRKHYNTILEIIQVSMKNSEKIMIRHVNEGEKILALKKDELEAELENTKKELKKLLAFQQKQFQFQFGNQKQNKLDIQNALKDYELQLTLPAIHLYTEIPELKSNFEKLFASSFSIDYLTQADLQAPKKQQKETARNEKYLSHQSSYQSYNRASAQHEEEADLFCDESLGESKSNKTHDFSFEKSYESEIQVGKVNDCILELVEEEDVISPVFKAI